MEARHPRAPPCRRRRSRPVGGRGTPAAKRRRRRRRRQLSRGAPTSRRAGWASDGSAVSVIVLQRVQLRALGRPRHRRRVRHVRRHLSALAACQPGAVGHHRRVHVVRHLARHRREERSTTPASSDGLSARPTAGSSGTRRSALLVLRLADRRRTGAGADARARDRALPSEAGLVLDDDRYPSARNAPRGPGRLGPVAGAESSSKASNAFASKRYVHCTAFGFDVASARAFVAALALAICHTYTRVRWHAAW